MDKNNKKIQARALAVVGQLLMFLLVLMVFFFALQRVPENLLRASRNLSAAFTEESKEIVSSVRKDKKEHSELSLEILKIGLQEFDGNRSVFSERNTFLPAKRNAIVFEVKNQNQNESGPWKFEARLPIKKKETFHSPTQASLKPGDRVRFIIGFENLDPKKQNNFSIKIHPL